MTPKEKYQDIDLSKLPEKAVERVKFYKAYYEDDKPYADDENKARGELGLSQLYDAIAQKYPEALKSKQAKPAEPTPKPNTQPEPAKKPAAKKPSKPAAKKSSTAKPKPAAKPTKRGDISHLAKEIRKDGERWQDAVKRAGEMIQAEKKKASDKQSKQLNTFLKKNPTISQAMVSRGKKPNITKYPLDVNRDAPRKALPAGRRVSKDGKIYYEYRQNRTDKHRKRYPYLALGGKLHGAGIFDKGGVLQIDGFNKNIMGTLSFNLKLPNMRKTQDFSVYPVAEKSDYITIQSGTRIGKIEMSTGRGLMSQSYPNGANFVHFQIDMINRKLVKFQLDDEQLKSLKKELAKTAGKSVGRSIITTDNSYADKFAKGGKVSNKFQQIEDSGDFQYYSRYFGKVHTSDKNDKEVAVNLLVVATIQDLEGAIPQADLPKEGNFQVTFDLVPESKFISKEFLEASNSEDASISGNEIVNIVNYMGGLRFEPADKVFFKTQEAAEKFLMSKELNDQITGMGFMSGFAMDKAYNRIGQSNWERLQYMMGVTDKFAKGGDIGGHRHTLHIDGQNWFLEKIDSTHFYMSNDRNHRGMAHHIGQHKGEPYYEEVKEWLKTTYAKGGEVKVIETNYDGVEFSRTPVYKGYYGWIAETFTKGKINGYDWQITTMKRYGGELLTTAQAGEYMPAQGSGFSGFSYQPFQDTSISLISSRPKMVNEKAVREQHIEALKKFAVMVNSGELGGGSFMAKGGELHSKVNLSASWDEENTRDAKMVLKNLGYDERTHDTRFYPDTVYILGISQSEADRISDSLEMSGYFFDVDIEEDIYAKGGYMAKGGELDINKYAGAGMFAGGGKTNEKLDLLENELTAAGIYVQRLLDMEKVPYLTIFTKSDPILENNFFFINKSGKYEMGNHYWEGDSEKAHIFNNIESIMKYVRSENFKTIADKQMEGNYAKGGELNNLMPHSKTHKTHEK